MFGAQLWISSMYLLQETYQFLLKVSLNQIVAKKLTDLICVCQNLFILKNYKNDCITKK